MYKLLIVDDLPLVRTGIVKILEKANLPLQQVDEAVNGLEALAYIEKHRPDIVITDIRMPVMDGIELIKKSKRQFAHVKFIVISGYAEFEYAKEALAAGVIAYVLKPANSEELSNAIRMACSEIDRTARVEQELAVKNALEREKAERDFRSCVQDLIFAGAGARGREGGPQLVPPYPTLASVWWAIVVFHVSRFGPQSPPAANPRDRAAVLQAETVIQERCNAYGASFLSLRNPRDDAEIVVLCGGKDESAVRNAGISFARHCLATVRTSLPVAVTAGIGNGCDDMRKLGSGYKEARAAVFRRFAGGSGQVYSFQDDVAPQRKPYSYPEQEVQAFGICLKTGSVHDSANDMRMMLGDIFAGNNLHSIGESELTELFETVIRVALDYYKPGVSRYSDDLLPALPERRTIGDFADTTDLIDYMMILIERLRESGPALQGDTRQLVNRIEQYIRSQFHENINLQSIAERNHIDFKYLSKVFKTVTGRHFNEYVTQVRLERAKELLKKKPLGIQDIARSVGYSDHHYFYQVFKKLTGMTPNEYRMKQTPEDGQTKPEPEPREP